MRVSEFQKATSEFIDAGLLHYANREPDDLTQVFMRGPFAGWSERQVYDLIKDLDQNRNLYRLEP